MARAAILPRLTWQPAVIRATQRESESATTLWLDVQGWSGHVPGQHVDVRLTAPNGYTATRPYSLGSAGGSAEVELTVGATLDGEVSRYLTQSARAGHAVEVFGPLGRWFVWDATTTAPVQLIGAGTGVVPLMSMLRTHRAIEHPSPMQLMYSLSSRAHMLYRHELTELQRTGTVTLLYSRETSTRINRPPGRIAPSDLERHALEPDLGPITFVAGPTGFVETVLDHLAHLGYDPDRVRAERYGERTSS